MLDGPVVCPRVFGADCIGPFNSRCFRTCLKPGLTALEMEVPPGHKGVRGLAISWGFTPFDATRPHRRRLARQTFEARCQRHE
ncbi:MAG: hypothetical protein R2857_14500 [Vampirovibrionales bacterium]